MEYLIKYTSCQEIERITGEDLKTIKQWKKGTRKVPASAIRLLRLYIEGDASALLGKDWDGHVFRDNLLFIPEWRRGLTAGEIRALFWQAQLVSSLKREIKLLKEELERRNSEIDTLEVKADFYKRQLVLESRFGMILQRSFL
ncbi:hypothetical protein [Nitrosomonas oligotropha]|uniref:Uncharacterized protein n=1 Tax=Nitrosomonas oligotropha TaxID=42354 RepID=A0A1H8U836_9PROT|nr:hypothetical protein [Nitrosomonas oligotropha]SDX42327.1 hypothetical protein SAMN05216300_13520 [Nitrosomonas oligotropha]SEO99013.1 hypothetical protein SAMN05216333_13120 [Nitrosomonas oligotropha]